MRVSLFVEEQVDEEDKGALFEKSLALCDSYLW